MEAIIALILHGVKLRGHLSLLCTSLAIANKRPELLVTITIIWLSEKIDSSIQYYN